MIDPAANAMASGAVVALARAQGTTTNMAHSHSHAYFEIYYLESGSRSHMLGDRQHQIVGGELVIIPPHLMHHSFTPDEAHYKRVVVYFDPGVVVHSQVMAQIQENPTTYRLSAEARTIVDAIIAQLFTLQDNQGQYVNERLQLLVNQLVITIIQAEVTDSLVTRQHRMTQVVRYLGDHFSEQITLDELAARFYISSYHLCREFKRFTGTTIVTHLNQIRVARARVLLQETTLSVTEISKQVGFANVSHFNRTFRRLTGTHPTAVRRSAA